MRAPPGARRWLAQELVNWAEWDRANASERVGRLGHGSLVGWVLAAAELSDAEKAKVEEALGPHPEQPV